MRTMEENTGRYNVDLNTWIFLLCLSLNVQCFLMAKWTYREWRLRVHKAWRYHGHKQMQWQVLSRGSLPAEDKFVRWQISIRIRKRDLQWVQEDVNLIRRKSALFFTIILRYESRSKRNSPASCESIKAKVAGHDASERLRPGNISIEPT